jgi:site-specific recombinase XerD
VREGFLAESPMAKVKVGKPKRKLIKPYTIGQIERMLAVCDWDVQHNARFVGSRNRAIILLLLDAGVSPWLAQALQPLCLPCAGPRGVLVLQLV